MWQKIEIEKSSYSLIRTLKIDNIDKWINIKEKVLKRNCKEFKKRIYRLSGLFDPQLK